MKKSYLVAAALCCALLVVDAMVLVVPVYAATCEVDCGGGVTLTCTGDTCEITPSQGCRAWEGGLLSEVKNCGTGGQ